MPVYHLRRSPLRRSCRSIRSITAALSGLIAVAASLTLIARPAAANPADLNLLSVTPELGLFRWTYTLDLTPTESLVAGDFVTVYDFAGLSGGITGPLFTGSSAAFGPNGPNTLPTDTAAPNVTWTYTGPTVTGVSIPGLSALSTSHLIATGQYSARTSDLTGPVTGSIGSIGPVAVPRIPEPTTGALVGLGLMSGLGALRRRTHRSRNSSLAAG